MRRLYYTTGDVIMDIGQVEWLRFLRGLEYDRMPVAVNWNGDEVCEVESKLTVEDKPRIIERLYAQLEFRLNDLILPGVEMKVLDREWRHCDEMRFRDPEFSIPLDSEDKKLLKTHKLQAGNSSTSTLRRNYVGLKNDWKSSAKDLRETVEYGLQALLFREEREGKTCPLCGEVILDKEYPITQNKHPFFGRHHNVRIRGYFNSKDGTISMCAACNLLSLFAVTNIGIPYIVGDKTNLFLPQSSSLEQLKDLLDRLESNHAYIDLLSPTVHSYRTNIRLIRSSMGRFMSLLAIYYCLRYNWNEEDGWEPTDIPHVDKINRWIIPTYVKGQNVVFGSFYQIDVSERLGLHESARLIRLLERVEINMKERDVFMDVLTPLITRVPKTALGYLESISKGLVIKDVHEVAEGIVQLAKERFDEKHQGYIGWLFTIFGEIYRHILVEVDRMLSHDDLSVVKHIARSLGQAMGADIGLATKIFNSRSEGEFLSAIRDAAMKYYKYYILEQNDKTEKVYTIFSTKMDLFLELVSKDKDNFKQVRDIFIIYFTIDAVNKKLHKGKVADRQTEEHGAAQGAL